MTGDELTTLLLRHGVEVMGVDTHDRRQAFTSRRLSEPSYTVHCRDVAAAALSPEMLPNNIELILHSEEHPRMNYLGAVDMTSGFRDEIRRMEGRGNFVLTSAPPRTQQLHGDVLRAMRSASAPPTSRIQQPTNTPSRRYPTPSASTQPPTAPPRRINDAELLTRLQSHLEASPRRFHWFTDAELRTLGKSARTPPWQRLECAVRDDASAAAVAQLLPSNVFLQLGNTTTGLWGSREDEVFVATASQQSGTTLMQQGFRADLWRRMCLHFMGSAREEGRLTHLDLVNENGVGFRFNQTAQPGRQNHEWNWIDRDALGSSSEIPRQADILVRWTIYQDLKPLYDIVDGVEGIATPAPMPEDVMLAWASRETALHIRDNWSLSRDENDCVCAYRPQTVSISAGDEHTGQSLSNFADILDAVAEARVAAATTQPAQQIGEAELRALVHGLPNVLGISGHIERGSRQRDRYIVRVTLVDRDVPLDSALAPRIPGNVHVHCQGRGEGGMRGVRGTGAVLYVPQPSGDHIVDALTQTQQHLQRRLDYDGLVALLRRHLGDDVRVTSITAGREGHFAVKVMGAGSRSIPWRDVPSNVTLDIDGWLLAGTSSQIFDLGRRVLVDKAPPTPRYFDADGDTVTTPDKAPPWLHNIVAEVRAKSARWTKQQSGSVGLYFEMPFAHSLTRQHITRIQNNARPLTVSVTSTNAPAPRVPVCMVRAIREQHDLAVLTPLPHELDLVTEWQQMPANDWRNVVVDIVENGCAGLADEVAAERASLYHMLMIEAVQAKAELAEYVRQWCAQFQTRFALLETDDADHTAKPQQRSPMLKRGKKPLTIAAVTKFRELTASRMCPSTAEAAKQAGIDSEIAVYVLQRWCGGLGDEEALVLLNKVAGHPSHSSEEISAEIVDTIAATVLQCNRPALDVAAALPPSIQAADEAAKKQRLILAQVAEQLRQERQRRAAQASKQPVQELSRFALLDVDEAADPNTATKAWHAQQARRKQPAEKATALSNEPTFTPPPPQHIHVPIPPHNGVDYVDATMLGQQLQDAVKIAGLVAAAEQSGLMKRVYEN